MSTVKSPCGHRELSLFLLQNINRALYVSHVDTKRRAESFFAPSSCDNEVWLKDACIEQHPDAPRSLGKRLFFVEQLTYFCYMLRLVFVTVSALGGAIE